MGLRADGIVRVVGRNQAAKNPRHICGIVAITEVPAFNNVIGVVASRNTRTELIVG